MNNFNKIGFLTGSILLVMLGLSQSASADSPTQTQTVAHMQHIGWQKSGNTTFQEFNASALADNEANIIFIRPMDEDGLQTSANIAIDGLFQVSLQPGHFSQVRYCSGEHNISVAPTGLKTNDLKNPFSHLIDFEPQKNHYLFVDIDDATGQPTLTTLNASQAKDILSSQKPQSFQISRVVRDCPPALKPIVIPEVEVKVELDKPINLAVLFEFDSAKIQPVFNKQIAAVANFMKKYPDTSTVIEGHTDSIGTDSYNMSLSQRRAEAVKEELVNNYGIEAHRLATQGYGETRPIDTNSTPTGRYNNRRVVATVSASK